MKKIFEIPYLVEILAVVVIINTIDGLILSIVVGVIAGIILNEVREKLGIKMNSEEEGETK